MIANIGGIVPLSTVDWHGRSSVVVFFNGCPFRCRYCHNYDLLTKSNPVDLESVKKRISGSKPYVSAVVFLGGEPLLQYEAVAEISKFAKEQNLLVGIHTNGFYPEAVEFLIQNNLADKFFVDVKAPFDKAAYQNTVGFVSDQILSNIQKTIRLVDASSCDLELKTTVFPESVGSETDIASIASWIHANVSNKQKLTYVLQQGKGKNSNDPIFQEMSYLSPNEMKHLADIAVSRLTDAAVIIQTDEEGRSIVT
jgi:anaerobic ribonucleoside-triphosphate reductase activating protein